MIVCARFTDGKPALTEEAAITLQRVVPVLWIPTNIYVELGATEVELDFAYLSICEGIGNGHNLTDASKKAYTKLRKDCENIERAKITPLLDQLEKEDY